ncbi:MAG: ABC transporter permease [Bacteroidetes bacterium]|nr:ABC transporter permease [Bacteroidota bacterium]
MSDNNNKNREYANLPLHVYAAGKQPGIVKTLLTIAKEFPAAHSLGYRFAKRNIKARYTQSILGIVWALLPNIAIAAVWIILNNNKIVTVSHTGGNYALFVIIGIMLWAVFTKAVLTPLQIIDSNRGVLVKINFPREALVILSFYEAIFNAVITLIVIVASMIYFQVPVSFSSLLFFPTLFLLNIMGLCIGTLLVPVSVLNKDINFLLPTFLQFAMYLTPVVYAQTTSNGILQILSLNPVSPVLTIARNFLLGIESPISWIQLIIVTFVTIVLFIAGIIIQRFAMGILIERMGS